MKPSHTTPYPTLRLRPGREYTLVNGHPWLFSGAFETLKRLPRETPAGAVVDVVTSEGEWVGRGHLNANNSLAFRLLTRDRDEPIDQAFYVWRTQRALTLRRLLPAQTNAYRLINAEGDGLPGLIVDRYDRWLVAQFHTAGVELQREVILAALTQAIDEAEGVGSIEGIVARDDVKARAREGLAVGGASVIYGLAPSRIEIAEQGIRYEIDPLQGQKTGFFLDQREKRARVTELARQFASIPSGAASPRTLLNLFAYSGGFALAGLAGDPMLRTVNVDSSAPALELARRNYTLNGYDPDELGADDAPRHRFIDSDVTRHLHSAISSGKRFSIVVVDPPAFAKSQQAKERALHAYAALNELAAQVVAPDGLLLTCSCSGAIDAQEFEGAVRQGLRQAQRTARFIASFGPSVDHPTLPGFNEDRYLKALLLAMD